MNEIWIDLFVSLIALFVALVLHAFLVMCEISLVKFRYSGLHNEKFEHLKRRRGIARLIENSDQTGKTVRFSKTLCTIVVGLLLMFLVGDFLQIYETTTVSNRWLVVTFSFMCAASVHFLFAEIFPRGLAIKDPAKSLRYSYKVVLVFQLITLPIMLLFSRVKQILFRRIGADVNDELNPLDIDVQIRAMGEDAHRLSPVVRRIMKHTLKMQELVVQDILLPRNQVVICDLDEAFEVNLKIMKQTGHTRFPLCRGNLDNCVGILHIKDIFRFDDDLAEIDLMKLRRNVAIFELETPLEEALQRMLRAKFHMALVVGSFGEIVGVVTFESILEELVGDIQDEFDSEEAHIRVLRTPDTYRISGLTPIHEIEKSLGVEIENEEVSTFSGLITGALGRIPEQGDTLSIDGMHITIDKVDERRVITTEVVRDSEA